MESNIWLVLQELISNAEDKSKKPEMLSCIQISFRLFWITSLIFSAVACILLILQLIIKLQAFPIISYMREYPMAVTAIPFLAVTLCPSLNIDIEGFDYEAIAKGVENGSLKLDELSLET